MFPPLFSLNQIPQLLEGIILILQERDWGSVAKWHPQSHTAGKLGTSEAASLKARRHLAPR